MSVSAQAMQESLSDDSQQQLGGSLRACFRLTSTFPKLVLAPSTIGEIHYGLKPTYVPNSPGWFRGIVNRRGALVPIFDLTLWLGLGRDASTDRRGVLMLDSAPKTAGLWILGEPKLVTVIEHHEADRGAFPDALQPYLLQGFESDEGPCFEFDHSNWFRLAGGRANV
jgi:chemotaxis signal transduction protein